MNLKLLLAALLLAIAHPGSAVIGQDAQQEHVLTESAVIGQDAQQEQVLTEAELLASLAGGYTTIKQPDRAIQLLEEALSFNQTLANPCHRLEILTHVAGNYALAGQETKSSALFAQAQKILETTKYCEPEPSSSARNDPENWVLAAAGSNAIDGRHDMALRIATSFGDKYLEGMLLGLLDAYRESDSRQPDREAEIQLKLADYYNRTGQSDKAVQVWLSLVNYYNETGQPDRAAELQSLASKVERTFNTSASSNQSPQTQAQTELSRCFAQKETDALLSIRTIVETLDREQLKQVLNICKEVERAEQADVPPLAFKALEQIVVAAQKIANPISRSRTFTAVANLYAYLEKGAEAAKLLDKALSDLRAGAENLRSDAPFEASRALEEIIAGYLRIGQIDRALEVAQLVQTGKLNLAASDFSQVPVDSNFAYQSFMPPIVAFYAQNGRFEQALQLANTLGRGHQDEALLRIAEQYASKGQYAQALKTALMIKGLEVQNKTNVIYSIIERAINAGELNWAVQATQTLDWTKQTTQAIGQTIDGATNETRFYRNKLLLGIAREYAELRQFDRAIEAVDMMSSDEFGNYRRVKALSAIAREYAQAEQTEEAVKLLEQALKIARAISPPTLTPPR
ncbi:tetratricopeptide repeat protein [Microcoleus sp. FACHB-SPT15]|uniref:tetratricopeptide repeat protein n=1 Tax=Microcoleus sp. FACHB-SPT15 TaxID=2692830 RepID=UPI001781ADF7|nr:tetratricopeptide repeat protein [Microcoleus sp. FACHB-SPT15]MBD1804536.1 tetratricopeptide repeat protein [Microcoleus sp. FACHB-SPT15]